MFDKKHDKITNLKIKIKKCKICMIAQKKRKKINIRKSFQKISDNNLMSDQPRQRSSKVITNCELCNISLCNKYRY